MIFFLIMKSNNFMNVSYLRNRIINNGLNLDQSRLIKTIIRKFNYVIVILQSKLVNPTRYDQIYYTLC